MESFWAKQWGRKLWRVGGFGNVIMVGYIVTSRYDEVQLLRESGRVVPLPLVSTGCDSTPPLPLGSRPWSGSCRRGVLAGDWSPLTCPRHRGSRSLEDTTTTPTTRGGTRTSGWGIPFLPLSHIHTLHTHMTCSHIRCSFPHDTHSLRHHTHPTVIHILQTHT